VQVIKTQRFSSRALSSRRTRLLIGALTLAFGVLGLTATASAAPPACGTVLTASTTLQSNLNCSTYSGAFALAAGAPNITINLNGYTVIGNPSFDGVVDGVDGTTPYNGVTVRNGDINGANFDTVAADVSGWAVTGITSSPSAPFLCAAQYETFDGASAVLASTTGAKLTNDVFTGSNSCGIVSKDSSGTEVSGVTINSAFEGIVSQFGQSESFVNNDILESSGYGIWTFFDSGLLVSGNTVTPAGSAIIGIYTEDTDNSSWESNTASGNGANGFVSGIEAVFGGSNSWSGDVSDNDTGCGASLYSAEATWSNDTFNNDGTGVCSLAVGLPQGGHDPGSSGTWTNPTTDNDANNGMYMAYFSGTIAGGVANHDTGVGIDLDNPGTLTLNNNTTNHDTDNGVNIVGASTAQTVENSTANQNTDYGFYADNPTSGTNNTADGDGTTPRCYNVICTS
jgi:Right handed beta helix region